MAAKKDFEAAENAVEDAESSYVRTFEEAKRQKKNWKLWIKYYHEICFLENCEVFAGWWAGLEYSLVFTCSSRILTW